MEGSSTGTAKTCSFCLKHDVKYTCPRCNIQYCSSNCYKSEPHSECSESFYKDCFMEGLKDMDKNGDEKAKIMEMLQRVQEETESNNSEDEDGNDLSERLNGLDLENDIDKVWSLLTDDEKSEFDTMVKDGRLSNMLNVWSPWWNNVNTKVLAETGEELHSPNKDLQSNKMDSADIKKESLVPNKDLPSIKIDTADIKKESVAPNKDLPSIKMDTADIKDLLKSKEPTPEIAFSIVNVLYGYTYMCRLHNGDHQEMPLTFVQDIQNLCGTFQKLTFQNVSEAVHSCINSLQNKSKSIVVSQDFSVAVISDVVTLIQGPSAQSVVYIMAALSDLHSLFVKARKELSKDIKKAARDEIKAELKTQKQAIFANEKKLEFLLSYVKGYGSKLDSFVVTLELMFCDLSSELNQHKAVEEMVNKVKRNQSGVSASKLIEEI